MSLPATAPQPDSQQRTPVSRNGRPLISRAIRDAIERMVHEGLHWDDAARAVGLPIRTMRLALERPAVIKYVKEQRDVFRTAVSATNIHHLRQLRDSGRNEMARLGAMRLIEKDSDDNEMRTAARHQSPGVVIVIKGNADVSLMEQERATAAKPLIEHERRQSRADDRDG